MDKITDDLDRLVREIDVIINGKDAAPQASLCDLVGQIRELVEIKHSRNRLPKIGDKLVVKKNLPGVFAIYVGDVLTVTHIDVEGNRFNATAPSGDSVYPHNDRIGDFLAFADEVEETESQPLTYREQLAEKFYISSLSCEMYFDPPYAFTLADEFIAELEKQRKGGSSTLGTKVDISA